MHFEIVIAKNKKGITSLKLLYKKLYMENADIELSDIIIDNKDNILIDCVKIILKSKDSMRDSLEIIKLPFKYLNRFYIESVNDCEEIIIKNKKEDEPNPVKMVF